MLERQREEAPRITLAEAKRQFDQVEATFVDVRTRSQYEQARIAGALSMPLLELPRHFADLPRDRTLVFY